MSSTTFLNVRFLPAEVVRAWLRQQEPPQTLEWLAREIGLRPNTLSMYLSGHRRLPLAIAVRINEITGIPIPALVHPRHDVDRRAQTRAAEVA